MFVQLFLLHQNNPTAVWLLIYTPCGAENFGGGGKQHVTFWGVNGHCCVSGPLFIIVTLAYFVTHWISHSSLFFLHLFPLVLLLCLIFSIFLSLSQAKQRLIPLVSNRDNHGNRPQLLSFGSVEQRHWSGWNSVMWKHKTHNWQMCTHVCVFVLGQKKKKSSSGCSVTRVDCVKMKYAFGV